MTRKPHQVVLTRRTRDEVEAETGVTIRGTIVSEARAEKSDYLVCMPLTVPLMLADNVIGRCGACNRVVQFRPHAPKKPARICRPCAMLRLGTGLH